MTTALDSSVLWAIIKQEPGHDDWLQSLMHAASEGPLIISPVAFAELAPSTADEATLTEFLARLAFKRYRPSGGPRQHLVPDFLIAAHAPTQAHRLAAIDRGYLRQWFPALRLLEPGSSISAESDS